MERSISEKELACRKILDTIDNPEFKACLDKLLTRWIANTADLEVQREIDTSLLLFEEILMERDNDMEG